MSSVECPYCLKDLEINHEDDYDENCLHEAECSVCNNVFVYTISVSIDLEAYKADCLNGGEHEMYPVVSDLKFDPPWMRCKNCNHETRGELIKTW